MEKQQILIVDDDPNIQKTLADILKVKGYEPLIAKNGAEGLAFLRQSSANLVIIDLGLPDMSGLEVLNRVKADHPSTEAIILTGNASLATAIEATNKGAFSFLQKPYEIDQLMLHIRRAIEKHEAEEKIVRHNRELEEINAQLSEKNRALANEVAERRRAEEALIRIQKAVESSSEAIGMATPQGSHFYQNKAFLDLFEYSVEELNKPLEPIVTFADPEVGREVFETIMQGNPWTGETIMVAKRGRRFPVFLRADAVKDDHGNIIGLIGIHTDITERKQAEETRQRIQSWQEGVNRILGLVLEPVPFEEKLKRITDSVVKTFGADFCRIWIIGKGDLCNTDCMHAEASEGPHVCRYRDKCLHLKASSGRYTHIDGKIHRRVPFGVYKIGRIASGEEIKFLTNDVQRDPRVHDHEWAKSLGLVAFAGYQLKPLDGETLGVFALFTKFEIAPDMDAIIEGLSRAIALVIQKDIAERKLVESGEALRQNAHFLQTLINAIPSPIFYKDIHGVYQGCNAAFEAFLGLDTSKIVGKSVYDLAPKELADKYHEMDMELLRRGGIQVYESSVRYADATLHDVIFNKATYTNTDGSLGGLVGVILDITERKRSEEKIQYLATHDVLTGLPNRLMFSKLLTHAIQAAQRYQRQFAVLFLDLDRFKIINDTLGHEIGDQLLQEIAARLKQPLRAVDIVSRLGGDEFVILIEEVSNARQVATIAHKILAGIKKPLTLMGKKCRITASIGICMYPEDAEDEQSLMKNADMAMYLAKEEGKNNYQFYSKDIQSKLLERLSIEASLRFALERNELSLHYQAKVDVKTNVITGVEALLRWQNPFLGSVTPLQFLPVAEETGLIVPIGKWVMKTACAQNVAWQQQGLPAVCVAINLSHRQLSDVNLIDDIRTALNDSGMAPNLLELEISESMLMYNPERVISILAKIKNMGVRLAIDDFGTGYASLANIKHFPIDTLKVDRSFIRNIPRDDEDKAITATIIAMAKTLSLTVVAEGVETVEQMNFLKDHLCDEMQGYYFSKPIMPEQFADLLRKHIPSL